MSKAGTVRPIAVQYLVEWISWSEAKAKAIKLGMPEDGEVTDYCERDDFERERAFSSFKAAIDFAVKIGADDWYGAAQVYRQFLDYDRDETGRVYAERRWFSEAGWDVIPDSPPIDEAAPDFMPELVAA